MSFLRSITRVLAFGGVTASALAGFASCASTQPLVGEEPLSFGDSATRPDGTIAPSGYDAAQPQDAGPDVRDARTDGGDSAPPTPTVCATLPLMVCNFDGTCPPYAAFGIGPPGTTIDVHDGGLDGSTAMLAYVPAIDGGFGGGRFVMPFQEPRNDGPTPPIVGCHVTCETNLRVASGFSQSVGIVNGDDNTFSFGLQDGGWVHTSPDASIALPGLVSADWVHVTVRLSPRDGGGATSEVTLATGDASATAAVPVSKVGQVMFFGAQVSHATSEAVGVYVDDVVCHGSD